MLSSQIAFRDVGRIYFKSQKGIAEKFVEAIPLHNPLKELCDLLTKALETDPPQEVKRTLWKLARSAKALDLEKVLWREIPKIRGQNR